MSFSLSDSSFLSGKTKCAGTLYRPDGVKSPPIVVMAHGFAAEKSFGLPAFAERFAAAGLAVFMFDYRNFGLSDGTPRNLVSPARHIRDWEAAIAHVRLIEELNHQKMALWGSSFSGGHVIKVAARHPELAAVVAQVPYVDAMATAATLGNKFILRGLAAAFRDLFRTATFRSPYYVPVVGEPDTFAVMNTPGSIAGYFALVPEGSSWRNECPARCLLTASLYRPITAAKKVRCPVLIFAAEKDSLIPLAAVEKTAALMPQATLVNLPIGHFDIYLGEHFEKVVNMQTDFLKEHLTK